MTKRRISSISAKALLVLSACAITTPSLAADILKKMEGNWRAKGKLQVTATSALPAKNDPLACRMKATYQPASNSLLMQGRCGSVSTTTSFKTVLTNKNGIISGKPLLQRGALARIMLQGKSKPSQLSLKGSSGSGHSLNLSFKLTDANTLSSRSSLTEPDQRKTSTLLIWRKQ